MSHPVRYEPQRGYSVPVVRVFFGPGNLDVLFTLSFTKGGEPINPPCDASDEMLADAWAAYKEAVA